MTSELERRCSELFEELGLGSVDDIDRVEPLTGGVASDIALVQTGNRKICVKFALPKLRVAADWQAPVHRNKAEYAWLQVAASVAPNMAVRLFGQSETLHGFAMEFVEGNDVYLWKTHLLSEAADRGEASLVGDLLGRIHAASLQPGFDPSPFNNRDDFHALRIEPYLSATAKMHPKLAPAIRPLQEMLYEGDRVLVHGDTSPKNILFRSKAPILLDAECATMGDASFDPSFCLNHLVLKAVHLPTSRAHLLDQVQAFWSAYLPHVSWENTDELEARVCRLLPALMLARVDGKSPVEYLSEKQVNVVRMLSVPLIINPAATLLEFEDRVGKKLKAIDA